jgi:hypothetical protein
LLMNVCYLISSTPNAAKKSKIPLFVAALQLTCSLPRARACKLQTER